MIGKIGKLNIILSTNDLLVLTDDTIFTEHDRYNL